MKLEELLIKKNVLLEAKSKLDSEIKMLDKLIEKANSSMFVNIKVDKNNPSLFEYYLLENKERSGLTAKHYLQTLEKMKELLEIRLNMIFECAFYEIDDPIVFEKIIEVFENSADLVDENRRRHNDISAAYNNYYQFLLLKRG